MTIAIDPTATFEWVDPPDRELNDDDTTKTVWELRPLTPTEEAAIQDGVEMQSAGDDKPDEQQRTSGYGTIAYRTVRLGLVRAVRNFRDAEGNEVQIQRGKRSNGTHFVQDASLAKIPAQTRARMCNAITTYGNEDDDEKKS